LHLANQIRSSAGYSGGSDGNQISVSFGNTVSTVNLGNGSSLNNSGTVNTVNVSSGATTSIDNSGSIGVVNNNGYIDSLTNHGSIGLVENYGSIGTINNSGSMNVNNYDGGYIGTVNTSTGSTTGIYNSGTINSVKTSSGSNTSIFNFGIINDVSMSTGNSTGIYNGGTVSKISIKNKETNGVKTVVPDEFISFSGGNLYTGKLVDYLKTAVVTGNPIPPTLYDGFTLQNLPFISSLPKPGFRTVLANVEIVHNMIKFGYSYATAAGAYLLDMYADKDGIYHAAVNCWQATFGYMDYFDQEFDKYTKMVADKFDFSVGDQTYILWAWKGDYLNLGAGAEMGIYQQVPKIISGDADLWYVNKILAMEMTMTLSYDGTELFKHNPKTNQWWITGFDPKHMDVNPSKLEASFTVNFNDDAMFDAFYSKYGKGELKDPRWQFGPWRKSGTFTF
jgi:hypothetical protein